MQVPILGLVSDHLGPDGGRCSSTRVSKIINRSAKKAGILQTVSAHTLRQNFATHMLEQGMDLRPSPDYYFIRGAKFKQLENYEFLFELKVICYGDDGCYPPNIKYYIHLVDGIRFEKYPDTSYDSIF